MDAGIEIHSDVPGCVSEYECREAAVYVHVPWSDWVSKLSAYERACAVAHYRLQILIRANVDDASHQAAERERHRARAN